MDQTRTVEKNGTTDAGSLQPGQGWIEAPGIGSLWLMWSTRGLVQIDWRDTVDAKPDDAVDVMDVPDRFAVPLSRYFAGEPVDPATLDVDLQGTEFQQRVWRALRRIPRGRVRTYAAIASDIGAPRAMRAVGMANRRNPLPIVVPCHRVVAAGRRLGGYSGGMARKRELLELEGARVEGEQILPGQLDLEL